MTKELEAKITQLEADNAALVEALEAAWDGSENCYEVLSLPHPGQQLLEELGRLRGAIRWALDDAEEGRVREVGTIHLRQALEAAKRYV